jgi:hypothetical protein
VDLSEVIEPPKGGDALEKQGAPWGGQGAPWGGAAGLADQANELFSGRVGSTGG